MNVTNQNHAFGSLPAGLQDQSKFGGEFAARNVTKLLFALLIAIAIVMGAFAVSQAASPAEVEQAPTIGYPTAMPTVRPLDGAAPVMPAFAGNTERWGLFADAEIKVSSPNLKIDAQGGIHLAYNHYIPLADHPQAVYAYCAPTAKCHLGEGWVGVELGEDVTRIMLALTKAGKPRLLVQSPSQVYNGGNAYHYMACDAACDNAASWDVGYVMSTWGTEISDLWDTDKAMRGFALDSQDRPGFIYYDRNYFYMEPDHIGGYYTWCEADCAGGTPQAPTWQDVYIGGGTEYDHDIYGMPALQYTSDNKPRFVAELTTGGGNERGGLIYQFCDANCHLHDSWQVLKLADRGFEKYTTWDLALDKNNRPHVAFYEGSQLNQGGHMLNYLTCETGCGVLANWKRLNLGLGFEEGESPDIEIQPNGKPAILYLHDTGLGVSLATCTGDCSKAADWTNELLDTATDLETEFPVVRPTTCDAGFWDAKATRLAFGPDGRLRIAYDAGYEARCLYQDPTRPADPPYYRFHQLRHAVRIALFEPAGGTGDPGDPGQLENEIYLPFVRK